MNYIHKKKNIYSYKSKDTMLKFNIICTAIFSLINGSLLVELTFELSDNAKECFHEEIFNETKCTLEFQVRLETITAFLKIKRLISIFIY